MSRSARRDGPTGGAPKCSVIIPVFNRSGLTRQCVDLLLAEPPTETDREIVVVDDASTDSTPELLAGYGDAVRVVRHEQNTGFATSCNDGAAGAGGEYLVFLNNDTMPLKGWLDALVRYANLRPKAAVIGCKLLFPDDTVQHAGVAITEDLNPRHIYAGFPADHPAVNKSRRFPIVTAGCALFRRKAFDAAGGFDDSFENGFEDVDLCLRLGELGHEVHYCHEAVLYHLEKATRPLRDDDNILLYRRRWAHKVQPDAMLRYLEDGLVKITFAERFPFFLEVSPMLALIEEEEREREADRLLAERAKQVLGLSHENIRLKLELAEAGVPAPLRSRLPAARREQEEEPKAMYLVSDTPGDPMRYRCDHHAEELELLGATARVSRFAEADLGALGLETTGAFVLHRVPMTEGLDWFIHAARERDKRVLFDTDDLVFESPAAGGTLDFVEMPGVDLQVFAERLKLLGKTLAMCDGVLVTTDPLAELARELNPRVYVVPNVASKEMVRLADDALAAKAEAEERSRELTIAYLSGSPTHDRDFLQAAGAVLWALEHDPTCRLLVVGNLTVDSRFDRHGERITRLPIQPWRRLFRILSRVDISLAPLEPGNPFTEAKSCLKYIEAGLVAVPTIASPRADFLRAIEPGRNGLLAEAPEEWQHALGELLDSSDLRARLGEAAAEDVRVRHTTRAVAPRLYETIAEVASRGNSRLLRVQFLVDPRRLNKRRAASLMRLVEYLRERNHSVDVYANGKGSEPMLPVPDGLRAEALPAPGHAALADISVALDPSSLSTLVERSDALFKLCLIDGSEDEWPPRSDDELGRLLELPVRPVCVGPQAAERLSRVRGMVVDFLAEPLDPAQFEQLLLRECFVRATSLNRAAA